MKKIIAIGLTLMVHVTYADVCKKLPGEWQGEWENGKHQLQSAEMIFYPNIIGQFSGIFKLADGSEGKVSGKCIKINEDETYLILQPEAPYFNPCRGTIMLDDNTLVTHFFCFKPNESGYFVKKS